MKKFNRENNSIKLNTLSKVLLTGLGTVLISGCSSINDECNKENLIYATQSKIDECEKKKKQISSGHGASGFFVGSSSNYSAAS